MKEQCWTFLLLLIFVWIDSSYGIYPKHPITEYCRTIKVNLPLLQKHVDQAANSKDDQTKLDSLVKIKKYLQNYDNCPDDEMLKNKIVSILVDSFNSKRWEINNEAADALGYFANGTEKQANIILKANAVPHLVRLLSSDNESLQKEAIGAFCGIMGHGPKFRDYCIKAGLVEPLIDLVDDSETSISILYDVAVMFYYVCQDGEPIVPYDTVVQVLPAIKTLMELKSDHEKMDGILISVIGTLGFIAKSGPNRADLIIRQRFVEKILPFFHHHQHSDVQKMAIMSINELIERNNTYHQHIIDKGNLKHLHILLKHKKDPEIMRQALIFLIHAIAPNNSHVEDVFAANLMQLVIASYDTNLYEIQMAATEVILVTSVKGSVENVEWLIENGIGAGMCKYMKALSFEAFEGPDESFFLALGHIVRKGKEKLAILLEEFEKCGGLEILKSLKKSDNFNIRFTAGNIVNSLLSSTVQENNHSEL